ncbi:hypothetical protein KI387_037548, partial [Taxus chinensis]
YRIVATVICTAERSVIPYRQPQPEAYRLYLALLNKYAFSSALGKLASCRE